MKRQSGIALIQVLLLSGILGLLMLQLGLTARAQVARAQAVAERAEMDLFARSREAALLYTLLTEPMRQRTDSTNPYVAAWNFHGEPFDVDGVHMTIRDQSGLARVPVYGAEEFVELLHVLGIDSERARHLGTELMQLQRGSGDDSGGDPRDSYPLQTIADLGRLPDMDAVLFARLAPILTLYPTPGLNPLTAPTDVLRMRLPAEQVDAIVNLRAQGKLDSTLLWKLTAIEADESTVLTPGPGLEVEILARRGDVQWRRSAIYSVYPYRNDAIGLWERRRAARESGDDTA